MGYSGLGIQWCEQLSRQFDDAMMVELLGLYPAVAWADGKHELYCMGGEL